MWKLFRLVDVCVGGLCVLALCVATAAGDEGTARSRVLNLAPSAFTPSNHAARYAVEAGGLGALCALTGAGYFLAPLQLIDGAVIERISAVVEDKSPDCFGMMSLVRRTPDKAELLAYTGVSNGAPVVETLSTDHVTAPVVDGQTYSYLLQVMLSGPGVCLRGAQVTYRLP